MQVSLSVKLELMRKFFDADGSRCIMFYYQSAVKDDLQVHFGNTDCRYVIINIYIALGDLLIFTFQISQLKNWRAVSVHSIA